MTAPFVHLRVHTDYSIEDGLIRLDDLIERAIADGQPAVAVTDINRMFNAINVYEGAREKGVKPIIGADVWVEPDVTQARASTGDQPYERPPLVRMLLLAQNLEGYRRLMDWMSQAYVTNQVKGVAAIKQSWMAQGTDGLIALSGDSQTGELSRILLDASQTPEASGKEALRVLEFYTRTFPDRFYLEVQRAGRPEETQHVTRTVGLARYSGVPLVATHPIQFAERQDYYAHEVKVSIQRKEAIDALDRVTTFTREQSFKTQAEMAELFKDLPEALENAGEIARRCALSVPLRTNSLPAFQTPNGETEAEFFEKEAQAGLEQRLQKLYPDPAQREAERPRYEARLKIETDTIIKMGFTGYFLIVSDFIRWAKDRDIPVGPGRGSGAGSLVAYSLKITDLDPLKYNLLFERFLNPERVSMPDFDIDFESQRREEVIRYVKDKYGEQAVSQIAAPGIYKAKAAIRAVGRTMQLDRKADSVARLIPEAVKFSSMSLKELMEVFPKIQEMYDADEQIKRLIDMAMRIEGGPSHIGKHAGGVLIAPGRLSDFTPLYMADTGEGLISQYDKDQVETAGLVKFDFLALTNLTVLQQTVRMINARPDRADQPLDLETLPLDDKKVFQEVFSKGQTTAVFQFESAGMQGMLRNIQPDRFEDLIALVALYRPGPMDLIPTFASRKKGEVFEYPDPRVESVLKETYGVMVYQEQVMQMAQIVGGYSLGGADLLRRAMGKKKPEEMAKHRAIFAAGAAKNGVSEEKANEIYDLMEKFAGYGFNKSHAAAYALLAYQTAYLKAYYPAEYFAAFMNVSSGIDGDTSNLDKVAEFKKDAAVWGVTVLPPDINQSTDRFKVENGNIRYGLAGLKGVNLAAIESIVNVRNEMGPFENFFDFFKKMGRSNVKAGAVKTLIKAGAFDAFGERAALTASVDDGIKYAGKITTQIAKLAEQAVEAEVVDELPDLNAKSKPKKAKKKVDASIEIPIPVMASVEPWSSFDRLEYERTAIGFYLSGHPFDAYKEQLDGLRAATPLDQIDALDPSGKPRRLIAGVVTKTRVNTIKNGQSKGKQMLFVTLHDGVAEKDVTLFTEIFLAKGALVKDGQFAAFEVVVAEDARDASNGHRLLAENVFTFDDLKDRLSQGVHVVLPRDRLAELKPVLENHAGSLAVTVYHPDLANDRYWKAPLNPRYNVSGSPECLRALKNIAGEHSVALSFHPAIEFEARAKPQRGPRPR